MNTITSDKFGRALGFLLFTVAQIASGQEIEFEAGLEAYRQAEESGNVEDPGYAEAFLVWEALAESGHAKSEYYLGELYWRGLGGAPFSPKRALSLTKSAAKKGLPIAQYSLAHQYEFGIALERDAERALKWYLRAASAGLWLAIERVAQAYERGELGLPVDLRKARDWRSARK